MDKETLSHYGWIVILVLILAVMLALATPFGSFVVGAIKSTTAGLFDVNQNALGSAGINVDDLVFENCDHLETEVRNVTDTYTGDTCCKACGAVLQAGQTVKPRVPEEGKYTAADGTVYNPGDEMPEVVTTGDIYTYGDYEYRYNQYSRSWTTDETQNGWGVMTIKQGKTSYGEILEKINERPVNTLYGTFVDCDNMTTSPKIPNTITNMTATYSWCDKLATAPVIPDSVTTMYNTFWYCENLLEAPVIPNSVTTMYETFYFCKNLKTYTGSTDPDGDFSNYVIPNSVTNMYGTFWSCKSLVSAPVIPSNVTTLDYTFNGCNSLEGVVVINSTPTHTVYHLFDLSSEGKNIIITGSSQKLLNMAQAGTGTNYRDVTFVRKSLDNISNEDYYITKEYNYIYDDSLNGWNVKARYSKAEYGEIFSYVEGIPVRGMNGTFASMSGITVSPVIPETVVSMQSTYSWCDKLITAPFIPNSVTNMRGTFWGCKALETAPVIHNGVTTMYQTFYSCNSLKSYHGSTDPDGDFSNYVIPSSVTDMYGAFSGCKALRIAPTIPIGVTSLDYAFNYCTALEYVEINANPSQVYHLFDLGEDTGALIVTGESQNLLNLVNPGTGTNYREYTFVRKSMDKITNGDCYITKEYTYTYDESLGGWNVKARYSKAKYGEIFSYIEGIPVRGMNGTFANQSNITVSPKIPETVVSMQSTYSWCDKLTVAPVIPNSVTNMRGTFWGCKALETAPVIHNGVTTMYQTFYNCNSLKNYHGSTDQDGDFSNYVIPSSVTDMYDTFRGCKAMTKAPIIPSTITNMAYTFCYCTALTGTVTVNATPSTYYNCFEGVDFEAQNLTLAGSSTILDNIAGNGKNYCRTCNGKCQGNH